MTKNIFFDRVWNTRIRFTIPPIRKIKNPYLLHKIDILDRTLANARFHGKDYSIWFASWAEAHYTTKLFYQRLRNGGGSIADLCKYLDHKEEEKIITDLRPFFPKRDLSRRTSLLVLSDD